MMMIWRRVAKRKGSWRQLLKDMKAKSWKPRPDLRCTEPDANLFTFIDPIL
jgi:hypothetical protein